MIDSSFVQCNPAPPGAAMHGDVERGRSQDCELVFRGSAADDYLATASTRTPPISSKRPLAAQRCEGVITSRPFTHGVCSLGGATEAARACCHPARYLKH
jgi:hypothetical protein